MTDKLPKPDRQSKHKPYILPDNDEAIPSMTSHRFNEMQEEIEADNLMQIQDLIDKYTKEQDE